MSKPIFKKKAKLEVEIVDMDDPKVKKEIDDIHREQKEIMDRTKITNEDLRTEINN